MPDFKNTAQTVAASSDVKVAGNPDLWRLINKASSVALGFAKSTKAMNVPGGILVQVSTEHRHPEFKTVTACAEAVAFIPGAKVIGEEGSFEIASSVPSAPVPALPPHAPAF